MRYARLAWLLPLTLAVPACMAANPSAPILAARAAMPEPAPAQSLTQVSQGFGRWWVAGRSREGRPIHAVEFGEGPETTLILGGFHGDERAAAAVVLALVEWLGRETQRLPGRRVVVVPFVNPDGAVAGTRLNAEGVDVNRNFPTRDWSAEARDRRYAPGPAPGSEPETRAVIELVELLRPAKILSLHDPLRVNNHDGPGGAELARVMAAHNGYPVRGHIGYPTPGSFGTWAGQERGIPMVTLEVERGRSAVERNLGALFAAILH